MARLFGSSSETNLERGSPMADKIETIPEKTRWEIATKALTGAYTAISNALKQAAGQKKFEEFNGPLWFEAGKGAREFANTMGLATESAEEVEQVTHLLAKVSMGPEFEFEVVEANKDRCVVRTTQCPWHKRWKEQGLDFDPCGVGHQSWGDGAVEALNPNFTFKLTKVMPRGDSYCEWAVERKK
jgi:L-2-amino-thiazoline-4-carboxylic acid hydrolase